MYFIENLDSSASIPDNKENSQTADIEKPTTR